MEKAFAFTSLIPTILSVFFLIAVYMATNWIFKRGTTAGKRGSVTQQIILSLIVMVGIIIIILSLPIKGETKGQITSLLGIVLSAAFALSSTTFLGNALAGIMNRSIKHLRVGDFIFVKDYFGKVADLGLFHTEIQNENRDLTSLPNMLLATNPVRVIRNSGTIISTTVSLGYDVGRKKIESCLFIAAEKAGLTEPYVYITELGDFSIVYKIHGLLTDTDKNITAKSRLNAMVLDALHEAKIEIVSPTFMNQRQVNETVFISKKESTKDFIMDISPEALIFDKAQEAETLEKKQERVSYLTGNIAAMKAKLKDIENVEEKENAKARITKWEEMLKRTQVNIKAKKEILKEID